MEGVAGGEVEIAGDEFVPFVSGFFGDEFVEGFFAGGAEADGRVAYEHLGAFADGGVGYWLSGLGGVAAGEAVAEEVVGEVGGGEGPGVVVAFFDVDALLEEAFDGLAGLL